MKNLVWLGRVLSHLPLEGIVLPGQRHYGKQNGRHMDAAKDSGNAEDSGTGENVKTLSLTWLMKKLCREARMELANNPKSTTKVIC